MGRASDLADELLEEAPTGAYNAAQILIWILALVLAGVILLALAVLLFLVL